MPSSSGPNTLVESNLVFAYDTSDVSNSYRGQPTTNIGNNFRDFTGTSYSPDGEWVSTEPTRFTKTYYPNLNTPIGPGATLIQESGTGGYHHLSRYGGSNESGAHSLSCYIYPLVSGITDFCIGMLGDSNNNIRFNLDTRAITYGGGISNTNAFIRDVPGWPGWLRVGANIEGRGGGWVGCFGYTSYTTYTGTAGGKRAYITGIQYEYTTQPTSFVAGTRSVTQGLLPLIGNSTVDLSNVSFNSNAQVLWDGTDDTLAISDTVTHKPNTSFTYEIVFKPLGGGTFYDKMLIGKPGWHTGIMYQYSTIWFRTRYGSPAFYDTSGYSVTQGNYYHAVATYTSNTSMKFYVNGTLIGENNSVTTPLFDIGNTLNIGGSSVNYSSYVEIPVVRNYNKALSAQEVKQNYQQYKTRFNLS